MKKKTFVLKNADEEKVELTEEKIIEYKNSRYIILVEKNGQRHISLMGKDGFGNDIRECIIPKAIDSKDLKELKKIVGEDILELYYFNEDIEFETIWYEQPLCAQTFKLIRYLESLKGNEDIDEKMIEAVIDNLIDC